MKPDDILEFWYGELDAQGCARPECVQRWWKKSDAFDRELEERFGALRSAMLAGDHAGWLDEPESLVAYVVVLDQFSRNIGRGTAAMYEADELALAASVRALEAGWHVDELGADHASSLFMPLMHSENLDDQDRCVELFKELGERYPDVERIAGAAQYAVAHRDIVARFGRFPHRNAILGRESTPEEEEFLAQPGSSF